MSFRLCPFLLDSPFKPLSTPYGDQTKIVIDALRNKFNPDELFFIGSCGGLATDIMLNDLVIPSSFSFKDEEFKFSNDFSESSFDLTPTPFLKVSCGPCVCVDTSLDETHTQLLGFQKQGFVGVEVEGIHFARATAGALHTGIIHYVSDVPLAGKTLFNSPPSFLGWRAAVVGLLRRLGLPDS